MDTQYPLLDREPDPQTPTVASDLEGTLSNGLTMRAIHAYLDRNGKRIQSRMLFGRRMLGYLALKALGKDYREHLNAWMRDGIRLFAGMSVPDVRRMADYVVDTELWPNRRQVVVDELNGHLAAGRRVVIVSGMPMVILESLLAKLPGIEAIGTPVKGAAPVFSGELGEFNVGSRKVEVLKHFADESGRIFAAYGDTYADLAMLEMSEHPAAVAPDDRLHEAAVTRGWRIIEAS